MNARTPSLVLVLILLLVVGSPMLSNDAKAEAGRASTATTFSYVGEAATVKLTGEWDWDAPVDMNLSGGVWSVDVELSEGLYCYKFIVDGAFIMDPSNPERIYCDGIENSLLRVRDHLRPTLGHADRNSGRGHLPPGLHRCGTRRHTVSAQRRRVGRTEFELDPRSRRV